MEHLFEYGEKTVIATDKGKVKGYAHIFVPAAHLRRIAYALCCQESAGLREL